MKPEDTVKLIQMRRSPVNSLQDLSKKLVGTREGFIFYTSNFRNDFETKMYMLGHLKKTIDKAFTLLQLIQMNDEVDWGDINTLINILKESDVK